MAVRYFIKDLRHPGDAWHIFKLRNVTTGLLNETCSGSTVQEYGRAQSFTIPRRWLSVRSSAHVIWPPYLRPESESEIRAITDSTKMHSYGQLTRRSLVLSSRLQKRFGPNTFDGQQVATLCPSTAMFVISQWATWQMGGASVPMSMKHPPALIEYKIKHSESHLLLCSHEDEAFAKQLKESLAQQQYELNYYTLDMTKLANPSHADIMNEQWNHARPADEHALFIYTSGTTGNPKGVVWTHGSLSNQLKSMVQCWGWRPQDHCLLALPLYHVHGLLNGLYVPLCIGASVKLLESFDPAEVWKFMSTGAAGAQANTVFTGVPTMYTKLLDFWRDNLYAMDGAHLLKKDVKQHVRLMMVGSAPLTEQTFQRWKSLTDHALLERYGMSETGMVLSNPLQPEGQRYPGFVGQPMPGMTIRICDQDAENDQEVGKVLLEWQHGSRPRRFDSTNGEVSGNLLVKSNAMFKEYWQNEAATRKSFCNDGFFITGDIACYNATKNAIRLLGRLSADIIKSSGYKLSALEIEQHLASCELIEEITVFGVPDATTGEKVVALVVVDKNQLDKNGLSAEPDMLTASFRDKLLHAINEYGATKIPKYSLLRDIKVVQEIPKNALGKVNKKELRADYVNW